ncbi:MAG: four helix bundle protein [Candidatus Moraniibacteriota bacterium]
MLKPYKDPYGFRKLLAFQKAEQVQVCCGQLTRLFPKTRTLLSLADQMDRSARSGKQNIVEGWKRNTTKEYYDFLGFSIGAIAELEEDCNDVWKGFYADLMGLKGVMGERGEMGKIEREEKEEMGGMESGKMGKMGVTGEIREARKTENPSSPLIPFASPFDIEKLKFYPLDENLPPVVQLKLRCKELNFLLHKLQQALLEKMEQERTLPVKDKLKISTKQISDSDVEYAKILENLGLEKLENGEVVKRQK